VTQDCTLGKDIDTTITPEKTCIEKEKQNLHKMKVCQTREIIHNQKFVW
jgi:hypothetical protein